MSVHARAVEKTKTLEVKNTSDNVDQLTLENEALQQQECDADKVEMNALHREITILRRTRTGRDGQKETRELIEITNDTMPKSRLNWRCVRRKWPAENATWLRFAWSSAFFNVRVAT